MQLLQKRKFYFLLSFLEGGSVMAAELLGAKMMAPYFGSSLYVWSSVLAITLGGLAIGYYAGGVLSSKNKQPLTLFYVLLAAAVFTLLMPFTSKLVLWLIGFHSLIPSVIAASICILLPPVLLMGMVSPLIIRLITTEADHSGKAAGAVYAISTVGGILATFAFGFYIIPSFGLTLPAIITGSVLGFIPAWILICHKEKLKGISFFLLCAWALLSVNFKIQSPYNVIYRSEGLLGQLMIIEYPHVNKDTVVDGKIRWLFVNRISQTMYDSLADEAKGEEKYFTYVYKIADYVRTLPKNSKILLLGLGGGSVVKAITEMGYHSEVCELDKRMVDVAQRFFYLPATASVTVDDARHFIKNNIQKYDVIIFDTFKGEEPPSHVFTAESLEETKKILQPNGLIIVNSMGYIKGKEGLAMRSIYKTLKHSGFNTKVLATDTNPDRSNLLFFASKASVPTDFNYIDMDTVNLDDAVVLQDEFPVLDVLNAEAAKRWRIAAMATFGSGGKENTLPLFR